VPVRLGGIRGIGNIIVKMHIEVNPVKGKGRHIYTVNTANLHEVLSQSKWKCKTWICAWDGGKSVMLETIWWLHQRPCLLLPRETVRRVWETENVAPLSHPYFLTPLLCQGGTINVAKGVYICQGYLCIFWGSLREYVAAHMELHVAGLMELYF